MILDKYDLTNKQIKFLEVYNKQMCNVGSTCRIVRIARSTFYSWKNKSKDFETAVWEVREGMLDNIESLIYKKIFIEEDTRVLIHFMQRKMKDRGYTLYDTPKETKSVIYTHSNQYSNLTDTELEEILLKLKEHN